MKICCMGDNLIISELSRLEHSMLECMEILSIVLERGIKPMLLKAAGSSIGVPKARSLP